MKICKEYRMILKAQRETAIVFMVGILADIAGGWRIGEGDTGWRSISSENWGYEADTVESYNARVRSKGGNRKRTAHSYVEEEGTPIDTDREARIARYAELAANEQPLFPEYVAPEGIDIDSEYVGQPIGALYPAGRGDTSGASDIGDGV